MIKGLHHNAYRCRNSAETRAFYEDFLGMELAGALDISESHTGREVKVLVDRQQPAGAYEVTFEAGDLPSGVYFYRLETGPFSEIRQMLLVK